MCVCVCVCVCVSIHGWTRDVTVTISSTDIYSDKGVGSVCVHPWMYQGCHSNYVIHVYSDKGVGSACMAIHGCTTDVTVTTSSTDTLTRG